MILFDNPTDKWVCASCRYETKEHLGDWDTCPNCGGNVWAEPHYKAWKTEPPTVEGWYWYFGYKKDEPPYPEYVYFDEEENGLCINVLGFSLRVDREKRYWLGPLPIPEPP